MAHYGCLQRSVESFYESVGGRAISGRAGKLDTTSLGQVVEELGLKLTCLVGGDCLRATETGDPAGQESVCHGFSCDVRNGDGFWPSCKAVDCSEAVCVACLHWKRSNEVYVDM
jgi:hypothetical protein